MSSNGAPQPAEASSVASSSTVQNLLVKNLVSEMKESDHPPPPTKNNPTSREERAENQLAPGLFDSKGSTPDDTWRELGV